MTDPGLPDPSARSARALRLAGMRDRDVVDALERGASPPQLPVFGCPVSDRLRRASLADLLP